MDQIENQKSCKFEESLKIEVIIKKVFVFSLVG